MVVSIFGVRVNYADYVCDGSRCNHGGNIHAAGNAGGHYPILIRGGFHANNIFA